MNFLVLGIYFSSDVGEGRGAMVVVVSGRQMMRPREPSQLGSRDGCIISLGVGSSSKYSEIYASSSRPTYFGTLYVMAEEKPV